MMDRRMAAWVFGAAALALAQGVRGDSLAARHFEQQKDSGQAAARAGSALAAHAPVTEIAIERSGPGAQYRAVITAGGKVAYTGVKAVARIGDFSGTISEAQFRELADYAARIGFFNLKGSYRLAAADRASVYVSVKAGAAEKIVLDYGGKGPPELKSFEQKIEDLLNQAALAGSEGAKGNQ